MQTCVNNVVYITLNSSSLQNAYCFRYYFKIANSAKVCFAQYAVNSMPVFHSEALVLPGEI